MKTDQEYARQFAEARHRTADILEDEAWRRAVQGVEEPVYQGGKLVGTVTRYSDTLMTWLLRGLRRERYGDKTDVGIRFDGDMSKLSIEQLEKMAPFFEAIAAGARPAPQLEPPTIDVRPECEGSCGADAS